MSDADVSDAFVGLETTLLAIRPSGSYVGGRFTVSTQAPFQFDGVVQNANPRDLQVLEEGNRNIEAIKIHTQYPLKVNDIINYDNIQWLVFSPANRAIGGYYKVLAQRQYTNA